MSLKQFVSLAGLTFLLAACSVADVPPQGGSSTLPPAPPTNVPPAKTATPALLTAKPAQPTSAPTVNPAQAAAAARVNGKPILLAEFEKNVTRRQAEMTKQGINFNTPEGQTALAEMRRQILEGMIEQELIDQQAAKLALTVTDAELNAAINQSIAETGGADAFNKYLANVAGMTLDEWLAGQREAMLTQKVIERVTRDTPTKAEQVHARHILVDTAAEANALLAKLRAGADFALLAQQYSKDTVASAGGGDLGWFPHGGLFDAALEKAAFELQPGQISGVVPSELGGFHIVQVLERDSSRPLSDDALREAQQMAVQNWLDALKASATIERLIK